MPTTKPPGMEDAFTAWRAEFIPFINVETSTSFFFDVTKKRFMNLKLAGRHIGSCGLMENHSRVPITTEESTYGTRYLQIHQW